MTRANLPKEAGDFLVKCISSVAQLELLLLMYRGQARAWSVDELVRELHIDRDWAAQQLDELQDCHLLSRTDAASPVYRFDPQTARLRNAVAVIAQLYAERRVAVIDFIYSRPLQKLRVFAESFRIKKDEDG